MESHSSDKIEVMRSTKSTIWKNFTSSPDYEEKLKFLQNYKRVFNGSQLPVKLLPSGDLYVSQRWTKRQVENMNKLFYLEKDKLQREHDKIDITVLDVYEKNFVVNVWK